MRYDGRDGGIGIESDALGILRGHGDIDAASIHDELSVEFLFGAVVGLYLQAVAGDSTECERSAVHQEIFACVNAVGGCFDDIDGAGGFLQHEVFVATECVACVSADVECSATCDFEVSLAVEGGFLFAFGVIAEGVGGACFEDDVDTLTALNINGRAAITGEVDTIEVELGFVLAIVGQRTGSAGALEDKFVFHGGAGVGDDDITSDDGCRDALCRLRNVHVGGIAFPYDGDRVDDGDAVDGCRGVVGFANGQGGACCGVGDGCGIDDGMARAFAAVPDANPLGVCCQRGGSQQE